ncbi:bone morphogenetic protein receptor type-2-like isoform X2 [Genypterus blacodes]|uniref:bone morphogenetic protein receptor type-2-like isoform X2 n=1 Tax=Genypterus blacodes TaxID=154954 RepID=UPI003F7610FE
MAVGGASSALTVCVCLLLPAVRAAHSEGRECAFADQHQWAEPQDGQANELRGARRDNGTIHCGHGSRCYGLWEKSADGQIHLVKQGCWTHIGDQQECHGDRCLVTATPSQIQNGSYRFCCCSQNLCNANFSEAPPSEDTPPLHLVKSDDRDTDAQPLQRQEIVLIALVTVAIAAVLIMALFLLYRMLTGKRKHSLSSLDVMEAGNVEPAVGLEDLKLMELIGRGRYGSVFRGCLNDRSVAVKLFNSANRQNYANECAIYRLPLLWQHNNIASFLTTDERTTGDGRAEFLIIMEYYPHGCLSHYLSVHTVDWLTCCRMSHSLTRGLSFLHTELNRGGQYKPAVAHRDVSSRNVLVRGDLSLVLADFGLSMTLTGNRPGCHGDDDTAAISEVGTVRYMAPEVLGGALNLRDCESALKQVDLYALGLLYWETFRRCSDLVPPGESVPDYQLAFQAELGLHPSFEEMQILVAREKQRPLFPEAWKDNSLALRSLKETMEDCWDQDAEARLTAQCAEERLAELTLLSTHNHRNLSYGRWSPLIGSCSSSYIEDLHVGVVKNLQGDSHPVSVVRATTGGLDGAEKNRKSINCERQQAQSQARSSSTDCSLTPVNILHTVSEHSGAVCVPVCLQLREEDLEATKFNPREVDKNLRESSDENLMEHSQKQFSSEHQHNNNLLYTQVSVAPPGGEEGAEPLSSSSVLPKQQNLPQRPGCLSLPLTCRPDHRQVETGVAKMNTAVEPHMVTTVTNNSGTRGGISGGNRVYPVAVVVNGNSGAAPTQVTSRTMGGGRSNPAGPQEEEEEEEEEKVEGGLSTGEDGGLNLLNSSPDEHEPLLRGEQDCLHRDQRRHYHQSGRSSNANNNNNRLTPVSKLQGSEVSQGGGISGPKPQLLLTETGPGPAPELMCQIPTTKAPLTSQDPGPQTHKVHAAVPVLAPAWSRNPPAAPWGSGSASPSASAPVLGAPQTWASHGRTTVLKTSISSSKTLIPSPNSPVLETTVSDPANSGPKAPPSDPEVPADIEDPIVVKPDLEPQALEAPPSNLEAPALMAPAPELQTLDSVVAEASAAGVPSPEGPVIGSECAALSVRRAMGRRPERPCSLDLSSSFTSSDDGSSLSASGEKIKRRIKTPYSVKKYRPASWVVSMDTTFDLDYSQYSSRSLGSPKINQSKSSMAVFLVGRGATSSVTSDPDGMTCF